MNKLIKLKEKYPYIIRIVLEKGCFALIMKNYKSLKSQVADFIVNVII